MVNRRPHGLGAADPPMKWPDRRKAAEIGYIGINSFASIPAPLTLRTADFFLLLSLA